MRIAYMLHALGLSHASEVQGYLQIRISESSKMDRFTVCAKNFEHYPRPELCESAPNMELSLIEEKGMLAQGQISKKLNRQVDFPFRFKWPVSFFSRSIDFDNRKIRVEHHRIDYRVFD